VGAHDLLEATALRPDDAVEGRWYATLDGSWDTPVGVHGGVLGVVGANALRCAVNDDSLSLRTLRILFLEPPPRDLVIDVQVLRRGRSSAFVRAVLHGGDQAAPAAEITGVLTTDRDHLSWLDASVPCVAPPSGRATPAKTVARSPGGLMPPLFTHFEEHVEIWVLPWADDWVADQPARYCRWYRWHEPPRRADGSLDPVGLIVMADLPGPAIWVRCDPRQKIVGGLSLDMSIHFADDPSDEWMLADSRARWLGRGHVLVETDLWSAGRLVAVSTQTMLQRPLVLGPED